MGLGNLATVSYVATTAGYGRLGSRRMEVGEEKTSKRKSRSSRRLGDQLLSDIYLTLHSIHIYCLPTMC